MLWSRCSWKPDKEDFITLSGKGARTGRYVVRRVKDQAHNSGKNRSWRKKKVFLTEAKLTLMILPINKRRIHFQGLVPLFFCLIFFWRSFFCDESKGWRGEKTLKKVQCLNVFCPTCKRTAAVCNGLWVGLQLPSKSGFSFPCTALPPSKKRQTHDAQGAASLSRQVCWREDFKPPISEEKR